MSVNTAKCPPIKIPNGQTVSQVVRSDQVYADAQALTLMGRNNTDGVITYTLQICDDPDAAAPAFYALKDASGAAVALPAQGEARNYGYSNFALLMASMGFRILASAPVTADRFFDMTKQWGAGEL